MNQKMIYRAQLLTQRMGNVSSCHTWLINRQEVLLAWTRSLECKIYQFCYFVSRNKLCLHTFPSEIRVISKYRLTIANCWSLLIMLSSLSVPNKITKTKSNVDECPLYTKILRSFNIKVQTEQSYYLQIEKINIQVCDLMWLVFIKTWHDLRRIKISHNYNLTKLEDFNNSYLT